MKFVVWIGGIEAPKIVEAKKWIRFADEAGSRVNFRDEKGAVIGTVEGTFAIFEAEEEA